MTNLALPSRSRMVCRLLLSALLALPAASAQTLIFNGKVSSEKTVVVGGKVYVPLSVLPSLGVQVSSGSGVTSLTGSKAVAAALSTAAPDDSGAKSVRDGWQDKTYTKLPQGAGFLYTFKLYPDTRAAVKKEAPSQHFAGAAPSAG